MFEARPGMTNTGLLLVTGFTLLGLCWRSPLGLTICVTLLSTFACMVALTAKRRILSTFAVLSSITICLIVISSYLVVAPPPLSSLAILDPLWVGLAVILGFGFLNPPLVIIGLLFESKRSCLAYSFLLVPIVAVTTFGLNLGNHIRMCAFVDLAERLDPVIVAINKYEKDRGHLPGNLRQLVPEYLASPPTTNMGIYRHIEFELIAGPGEDAWELVIPCSSRLGNFDEFFYQPSEKYLHRSGGVIEPIGKWAYFHE